MCNKANYPSRKEAKAHMKLLNHNKSFGLTDVYKCIDCGNWHTTSMAKRDSRSLSKRNEKNKRF